MQVILKNDVEVVALIGKVYSSFPLDLDLNTTLNVRSAFEVIEHFYRVGEKIDDDVNVIMHESPCETGEDLSFYEKKPYMKYYVQDNAIYQKLKEFMLEDWQQRDYADSQLSHVE